MRCRGSSIEKQNFKLQALNFREIRISNFESLNFRERRIQWQLRYGLSRSATLVGLFVSFEGDESRGSFLGAKEVCDSWFLAVDGPAEGRALIKGVADVEAGSTFHKQLRDLWMAGTNGLM